MILKGYDHYVERVVAWPDQSNHCEPALARLLFAIQTAFKCVPLLM